MKTIQARKSFNLVMRLGKLVACVGLLTFNFSNKAAADGPWDAYLGLTSTQGPVWYYQERPQGSLTPVTNMIYSDAQWRTTDYPGSNMGWLGSYTGGYSGHPGASRDIMRVWAAPSGGTVSITGNVFMVNTAGASGIIASVEKQGTMLWSRTVAYNDANGYFTDSALGAVSVSSGEKIAFIVDDNGVYSGNGFAWDPVITKVASYDAYLGLTCTQGPIWYYKQRPQGGGTVVDMIYSDAQWRTTDYPGSNMGWLGSYTGGISGHPGASLDVMRVWVAPSAGTIAVRGNVYKVDTSNGAGIIATVEKNTTMIWSRTVAYNDALGYWTDPNLCNVSVTANDSIAFIVDDNHVYGNDSFAWDPVIGFDACTGSSWMLNTDDTLLTIIINNNKTQITNIEDRNIPGRLWVSSPEDVPMPNQVNGLTPNWSYTSAVKDTTSGTKVTLTYTSTTPSLTLTQCWWAHLGGGPVEENTSITNNTGASVTYNDANIVATDLTVTSDADVTLWRFNRSSSKGSDPGFTAGVYSQVMAATTSASAQSRNIWHSDTGQYILLPFEILDVGGTHGLYLGYTCDFAQFTVSTSGNAHSIRNVFSLWTSDKGFSQATGTTLCLPGMFVGTYKGDIDCGSNKMKKWFWSNKMTPTIRSTTNEPLAECNVQTAGTEAGINGFFTANPSPPSWGLELVKEDYTWPNDEGTTEDYEFSWAPNIATSWPNGMNLGSIVHSNGPKLALYMANTYNHADLSTTAGVASEESALLTRFDGTATNWVAPGYDYWRTDYNCENLKVGSDNGSENYLAHLGFLSVLDYMISSRGSSGFRWENCSGGGSKKSFDILQRQSLQTTEDDGYSSYSELYYRMAYYANSYMINPVQMQTSNVDSDWTGTLAWVKYTDRAGYLGAWMFGASGTNDFGPAWQFTELKSELSDYQTKQRPILRGADVYHILPMPDGTNWDGIELLNTTLTTNPKGSVVLFKPHSSTTASGTFYLKGLLPGTNYTLVYQDRTGSNTVMSGSSLMTGGTGLTISGSANEYDSEIIWLSW